MQYSKYGTIQIKIADENGEQIFDEWYAFSDLGLWDQDIIPVYIEIDDKKVNKPLGKVKHGIGNPDFDEDYSYFSQVSKSKIDGQIAYGDTRFKTGIGAQCIRGEVYMTVAGSEIWAAQRAEINYSVYVDDSDVFRGKGRMFKDSYKVAYFKAPKELENIILNGGVRFGYKLSGLSGSIDGRRYLDGYAEMYSRVAKHCG